MLIDFHTHAFPEKIAARAMKKLADDSGLFPHTDGTADSLRELMQRDGVDLSVLLPIVTNPASQSHTNDHAIASGGRGIIAFGSVHPDAPDALDELERLKALGVKGLKFHPEYQGFYVDDEKMRPIYRKICELGFITIFHSGAEQLDTIVVSAGKIGYQVELAPEDLLTLTRGKYADVITED